MSVLYCPHKHVHEMGMCRIRIQYGRANDLKVTDYSRANIKMRPFSKTFVIPIQGILGRVSIGDRNPLNLPQIHFGRTLSSLIVLKT